jgi:hypothetical protein
MNKKGQSVMWILIIGAVLIIAVIIIVTSINRNRGNNNIANPGANNIKTNYTQNTDGTKVNTSVNVSEVKKVGDVLLEQSKIVYTNGTSKLTSKVTNNGTDKDNLRFKVKFIANDGTVMAEAVGFVGKIKANETKYIDSFITIDTSNSKNITYELM